MKILILGAGDLSSGIAVRLYRAGFNIIMTDISFPTCVRRSVSFAEAVYEGTHSIEGITAKLVDSIGDIDSLLSDGIIPVIKDDDNTAAGLLAPDILIDARMAKRNLGISINDAPFVIGIGPGFTAKKDCHAVIETMRGHTLGRVIYEGSALPNTGIPGNVGGYTTERLIRSSAAGIFHPVKAIKDRVTEGDEVAYVVDSVGTKHPVYCNLTGIIRGMLHDGIKVDEGMKSGDVDARCKTEYCDSVSDKALSIGGGVLEAVCSHLSRN